MINDSIYKICEQKLYYLNYSRHTISIYLHYIKQFLNNINKNIQRVNSYDFQNYLTSYKYSSISQQKQIINSIRFLYKYGLNKKYNKISFEKPLSEKKLPIILNKSILSDKINKILNLKHKTIISLGYSVGLRVSEIINLKICDIDSLRMIINIKQSKGKKDRIVPLSESNLLLLRKYYKKYKPHEHLFNGQNSLKYSANSCNQIVKKYIGKEYHFHSLRHSCFTHLLEEGVDLRIIQQLAGHSSSKTTEIYTHVSNNLLQKIPSLL